MSESPLHDPLGRSRTEIKVEVTVAALVLLSAMSGNMLVVYVIYRDSRLHKVTYMFIHNLALTDIAMAMASMPFWIASLSTGTWKFGQVWCQVVGSTSHILACASIFTIALITFNRYIKVVKSTLYRKVFPSKRVARRLYCVFVWLVSIFLATPYLFGWSAVSYHEKLVICVSENNVYKKASTGVIVNGLTIMIFYCNFKIYKAVRESTRNLNAHAEGNGVRSANDSRRSNMTDVSVLKTCFTVACFFVVTWSPISIIAVIWTLGFDIPQKFYTTSIYLAFSRSFVNPIIYGFINPQFKEAFKKALTKIYLLSELVCSYDKLNKYPKRIRGIGSLRWKFFFPIGNRDSHNWENTRKVFFN